MDNISTILPVILTTPLEGRPNLKIVGYWMFCNLSLEVKLQYLQEARNIEPGQQPTYICSLFSPDLDPVTPIYDIPDSILIGPILTAIWRHHHAFVLDNHAFEPQIVLAAVDVTIIQARAQLAEK
ncbi:hypothetical protein BGZ96_011974 [Linnemannia gamsii]|uniref:Uncharacterized protein n=1 Tax=Linnemannia gamsii TaxID=64522 RepID=A0ABQ7JR78_9FUNG|nr:hypothetical protein BGZ96_011974 [Linnemannia gamsii]